jgi:LuxR family maltose regulon positive regulatory protein
MENNLLITRTRILVPRRRPELLSRDRLLDWMLELLDNKLIIVAAPAGYGKTSLLIDVVHHVEWPVCWYALDALDQDPIRFIAHFIAALNLRFPKFGIASNAVLQTMAQEHINLDLLLATVINDAYENISEHFVIVLDDYHLVNESKTVNQFVSRFIQDVDENCHLIIASRILISLPDMPLLVARSQVGGLSFEELAFRPEEIQELLLQNQHMTISESAARELVKQTEGWITGLLLSTQMLGQEIAERQTISRVSGVGLYEYLTQQVFNRQPPVIQDFLLRTSLLEEFDAEFCAEVIDPALETHEDWNELMLTAMHNNLFILPVEDERVWLRYHHLFSEFLQNRIVRDRPEEAEKIQLRLAEVYAHRSQWEQVYRLYQRLGKLDAIANLIEEAGLFMVSGGRLNTLSNWLVALPEKVIAERPALLSIQGSVAVMRGDTRRGLALFDQAIEALSQAGITNQLALALVRRSGAHRLLGEYTEALGDAEEALWLTGQNPILGLIRAEACRAKGITLYQQGQLKEALHWLTQSEASYRSLDDGNNSAKLLLEIGIVNKASGNLEAAEQAYARALEHWEKTNNSVWQANLLNNLGVLQHLRGDYVTAASNFERAIQHAKISSYPRLEAFALTSIGDLYRDLDAPQESWEAYQQARQIAQRIKDRYLLYYLNLAEGVLARTQKQMDHAREMLNVAREMASESGSQGEQNLCRLETAVLDLATRAYPLAESSLESALIYFKQEGQQAEAVRASFYLALVCGAQKNCTNSANYFKQLTSKADGADPRAPLITAAREFIPLLHLLKREPALTEGVTSLLDQIDQFELTLPALRTQVRRRASVVPFAPPRMVIRAFGRIEVKIDERLVSSADWQTQTARDLFYFILAHPEGLTKEAIGLVFWPDSSPAELKLRFKNTVYRLRHAAGRDVILFQDEIYRFNINMDYEYDIESFLKEIDFAQKSEETQQKITHCKSAIQAYKGTYLPEVSETWVVTERERLYQLYIDTLVKLAGLYLETHQHEAGLETCQMILRDDPCMEAAHRLAMRILAAMGNRAAMVRQYELCKQALKEEYDATPSPQTEQLYAILTR